MMFPISQPGRQRIALLLILCNFIAIPCHLCVVLGGVIFYRFEKSYSSLLSGRVGSSGPYLLMTIGSLFTLLHCAGIKVEQGHLAGCCHVLMRGLK